MKPCVILLSGGLDSTTTLAIAKEQGFEPLAISFCYGARHSVEIESAKAVVKTYGVKKHEIVKLDLRTFGKSSLTSSQYDVPKGKINIHAENSDQDSAGIPNTYVPARNTIFLSYALAFAEVNGAKDIFMGANIYDYSAYPDCRPEYLEAFEAMANLATKAGVEGEKVTIHAPLMHLNKSEIIKKGMALGVDYAMTHSCYDPIDGKACGNCDACLFRKRGFLQANIKDPTRYASA